MDKSKLDCIMGPYKQSATLVEISTQWESTFTARQEKLLHKEKHVKTCSLETYFRSFPCLNSSIGMTLVRIFCYMKYL